MVIKKQSIFTVHSEHPDNFGEMKKALFNWLTEQRRAKLTGSTQEVIFKAFSWLVI